MTKKVSLIVTLLLILAAVTACGGPPPAAPTAPPPPPPTEAAVPPTATPAASEAETDATAPPLKNGTSDTYTHPSGAFSMDRVGTVEYEDATGVVFTNEDTAMMVVMAPATGDLSDEGLAESLAPILDAALIESEVATDYQLYLDEAESVNNGYRIYFSYILSGDEQGDSELFVTQAGETLYVLILLTPDYDGAADAWLAAVESFTPNAEGAVAEGEPPAEEEKTGGATVAEGAADSGFRPEVNGFSFPNYGNDAVSYNLTEAEIQRLFGEQVCANTAGGCTLAPPVRQWMEQINGYMDGGHCEGMAVLSLLMYYGQIAPADFGGETAHDLSLSDEALQREIAYWWTTQALYPTIANMVESPKVVLNTLLEAYQAGENISESWTIGIYKEDGTGGHAITPFAVEDKGGGIYHILVYDNNWPDLTRVVEIDTNNDTFSYEASTNPNVEADLYTGKIELTATSGRLEPQECQPCVAMNAAGGRAPGLALLQPPGQDYIEIWLDGDADLLITDAEGRRIGWIGEDEFVNEIPGAKEEQFKFADVWANDYEPVYYLPVDIGAFRITVDGTWMAEPGWSDVTMIGPGYDMVAEELYLEPGEQDHLEVVVVGEGQYELTYLTDYTDSPDIWFGISTDEADYEFVVRGTDIDGGTFHVGLDFPNGDFILNTTGNEEVSLYDMLILRIDDNGEYVFGHQDIELDPEATVYANFLEWEGDGSSMYLDFDDDSDGTIDESVEMTDDEGFYEDFYKDWE
jgi:hypothetical protein